MAEFVTHEELVEALAGYRPPLDSLPMRGLQHHLEQHWFPEAPTALLRKSVTAEVMGVLPHWRLSNSGTQTITTGAGATAISFATTEDDTDDLINGTVTQVTIRTAGRYFLTGSTKWTVGGGGGGGFRALELQKNGVQLVSQLWYPGADLAEQNVATSDYLRAGDIITLKAATTAAANHNIQASRFTGGFFSS